MRAPFTTAGWCHCHRCQRRTGSAASANARVPADAFAIVAGADAIGTWEPADGWPKTFCQRCGGHVYSGDPATYESVGVRLGAIDGDPGIRPTWRQWVASAAPWTPIPDDGLERFEGARPE